MLTESQKHQLDRFRALNQKYNVAATIERVGDHIVFRKKKKANCVYIDEETFHFIQRHYFLDLGVSARLGAGADNRQTTYPQ
jgi:hypothetical protein